MEWNNKIKDECCAEELEELIIDSIRAGFLSNNEILMDCEEYINDFYHNEWDNITKDELLEIIKAFRKEYQNTGNQENFLKLQSAFRSLKKHGIVALHYAGYTQSDGFVDCNEVAAELEKNGEKMIGCCFYTPQDLEHLLHEYSDLLYISFGNYFEQPAAEEIAQIIVDTLKANGFCVQWDGTANTKIAIKNFKWDKYYTDSE